MEFTGDKKTEKTRRKVRGHYFSIIQNDTLAFNSHSQMSIYWTHTIKSALNWYLRLSNSTYLVAFALAAWAQQWEPKINENFTF